MYARNVTVNASTVRGFDELIKFHVVNTSLGGLSLIVNSLLLLVFLSHRPFRKRYVLLILLCFGDLINSLAIVLTGLNRIRLYSTALSTLTLPIRTSVECASETWLLLKLIGDLLIPIATFWMGVERLVAILFPIFYRFSVDGKAIKYLVIPAISCFFVFFTIVIAMSFAHANNHYTHFYCGRKAAFGEGFGTFIYMCNITCNVASTSFATAAYVKAVMLSKTQPRMQRQVNVIRYYLLISVLSTLLVSLPNAIALLKLYVVKLSASISKPAYWMQTINSGVHFFVYLALNKEFRARAIKVLKMQYSDELSLSSRWMDRPGSRVVSEPRPEGFETSLKQSRRASSTDV